MRRTFSAWLCDTGCRTAEENEVPKFIRKSDEPTQLKIQESGFPIV
jgi:hypothetical protein